MLHNPAECRSCYSGCASHCNIGFILVTHRCGDTKRALSITALILVISQKALSTQPVVLFVFANIGWLRHARRSTLSMTAIVRLENGEISMNVNSTSHFRLERFRHRTFSFPFHHTCERRRLSRMMEEIALIRFRWMQRKEKKKNLIAGRKWTCIAF